MDERDAIIEEVFGREFTGHPAYRDVMQAMDLAGAAERRRVTREIEALPTETRMPPLGREPRTASEFKRDVLAVVSRGVPEREETT